MSSAKSRFVDIDYFLDHIEDGQPHECANWPGSLYADGRGRFRVPGGRQMIAYRAVWEMVTGDALRPDQFLCHRCDNPACVRPSHLYIGDAKTNAADMIARNRHPVWSRSKRRAA